MPTTGYSGKPLYEKLGIKPNSKILLINPPPNYTDLIEIKISNLLSKNHEVPDLVHFFAKTYKEFEQAMKKTESLRRKNSGIIIWVSWYKKSAKIPTDINEDIIREYALKNNLVDIKVCSVSEIWSGLKLVVPLAKR